jgi:hypothetical protein
MTFLALCKVAIVLSTPALGATVVRRRWQSRGHRGICAEGAALVAMKSFDE